MKRLDLLGLGGGDLKGQEVARGGIFLLDNGKCFLAEPGAPVSIFKIIWDDERYYTQLVKVRAYIGNKGVISRTDTRDIRE